MKNQKYKATLSKDNNRGSWCVIFRHPLKQNDDGSPGRRVRRGLGTSDKEVAEGLVNSLNALLSDEQMWNPSLREKANALYPDQVVRAFYDDLAPGMIDLWAVRNEFIPLPSKEAGFAKALILGTTGAGKTTLTRQLIGTNPASERFPSTSTAKTTVCDIELVFGPAPYKAVVTFFSRDLIRLYVEESATAAAVAHACFKSTRKEVTRKLLEHSEQRFRLSYLLGTLKEDDELEDEAEDEILENPEVTDTEREKFLNTLTIFIGKIEYISEKRAEELAKEVGHSLESSNTKDADAFQELFEPVLRQDEEFHALLDGIMDEVESKFSILQKGELKNDRAGWPSCWTYESSDRSEFISQINRFTSNYAPNFGKLLTPLVEGVRVCGPFCPSWTTEQPKLVLMDGEGLGHTPDSGSSVSTKVTKRFEFADAILLVDNAKQPMQAAPIALLRSLVATGHAAKLILTFTHFDQIKGDNLPNTATKKAHVLGSVDNALASIAKTWGINSQNLLKRTIEPRTFFVANIHKVLNEKALFTQEQLKGLLKAISSTIIPPRPTTVIPTYDFSELWPRVQRATKEFRYPWRARLRLPSPSTVSAEHWTRIKALSRRFAHFGRDEYMDLKPVADLIASLSIELSIFISTQASWDPSHAPDEMKQAVLDKISQEYSNRLHALAQQKLFMGQLKNWGQAYDFSGTGSTFRRSREIDGIYDTAAPLLNESEDQRHIDFLKTVRRLLEESILAAGGKVLSQGT